MLYNALSQTLLMCMNCCNAANDHVFGQTSFGHAFTTASPPMPPSAIR